MDPPPPRASSSAREISSSAVVCYGKPAPGVNVTHQLITFFRFTELKDPNAEVEAHHAYIAENGLETVDESTSTSKASTRR